MKPIPETGARNDGARNKNDLPDPRRRLLLFEEISSELASLFLPSHVDHHFLTTAWNDLQTTRKIFKADKLAQNYLAEICDREQVHPFEYINDDLILETPLGKFSLPDSSAAPGDARPKQSENLFIEFDTAADCSPAERCGMLFTVSPIDQSDQISPLAARTLIERAGAGGAAPAHPAPASGDVEERAWLMAMNGALTLGDTSIAGALWQIRRKNITHTVKAYPFIKLRGEKQPRAAFLVWHFAITGERHPVSEIFSYPTGRRQHRRWFEELEKGSRLNCLTPCLLAWHSISQAADQVFAVNGGTEARAAGRPENDTLYFAAECADWRQAGISEVWPDHLVA